MTAPIKWIATPAQLWQAEAGAGSSPAPVPGNPPAPPAPDKIPGQHTPVVGADGIDKTAWFADKYNEIKTDFELRQEKFLLDNFGTNDLNKIKGMVKKSEPAPATGAAPDSGMSELMAKIQDQSNKISDVEKTQQATALENAKLRALVGKNAADSDMVIYAADTRADYRKKGSELLAFQKGSEIPILDEKGKQKTFSDIIGELQKDPRMTGLFIPAAGSPLTQPSNKTQQHTNGTRAGFGIPDRDQRMNKHFMNAIRDSGQWNEFIDGKEINIDAVMKKM